LYDTLLSDLENKYGPLEPCDLPPPTPPRYTTPPSSGVVVGEWGRDDLLTRGSRQSDWGNENENAWGSDANANANNYEEDEEDYSDDEEEEEEEEDPSCSERTQECVFTSARLLKLGILNTLKCLMYLPTRVQRTPKAALLTELKGKNLKQ
jgi:hypothetical protein